MANAIAARRAVAAVARARMLKRSEKYAVEMVRTQAAAKGGTLW